MRWAGFLWNRGITMLRTWYETITMDGAWFLPEWGITMLWPLSRNDHNLRSMFLTCSVHCHETMTTVGACFIHKWYITMLWPLSWDDNNWGSMFHTLRVNNHALTVVMRRWQLTEHASYINDILPCSDRCHEMLTTDGAWLKPKENITMLWPLSLDDNNLWSMVHTLGIYYHALTSGMRR